jgi:hypothetical protein
MSAARTGHSRMLQLLQRAPLVCFNGLLTTERETVSQQARETGGNDLLAGAFDIVTDPALLDQVFVGVINAIGRAPITVAWLSDAAGVDEILFAKLDVNLFLLGAMGAFVADEGALDVSMTEETDGSVLVGETGGGIEVAKDVTPLRGSIESRVHNCEIADLTLEAQVAQPFTVLVAQLLARPSHGPLCHFIEIASRHRLGSLLVVISLNGWAIQIAHDLDALARIGVVADDIAQANEMRAVMFAGVRDHGLERLQVCMHIAENGKPHLWKSFVGGKVETLLHRPDLVN